MYLLGYNLPIGISTYKPIGNVLSRRV